MKVWKNERRRKNYDSLIQPISSNGAFHKRLIQCDCIPALSISISLSSSLARTGTNKQTNAQLHNHTHTHTHADTHAHALIHTFFLFLWRVKKGLGHAPSPFALHHLSLGSPNLVMLSGHYLCEIAMHTILLCKQWEKIFLSLSLSLVFYQYSKHWKTL